MEPVHLCLTEAERESLALSVECGMEVMLDFNLPCESDSNLNCCFVLKCLSDGQICYCMGVMG